MVTIAFQPALARARAALERGQHAEAVRVLTQALKVSGLKREDEVGLRCTLAEAWLLGDDVAQATAVLGRPPTRRDGVDRLLFSCGPRGPQKFQLAFCKRRSDACQDGKAGP